jgi:EAL and modified HD-GYP domain-containing signal transduction protein
MLNRLLSRLFGGSDSAPKPSATEQLAAPPPDAPRPPGDTAGQADRAGTTAADQPSFVCREVVLDREQHVAGYEFLLRKTARDRVGGQDRRIRHAYADVLVRSMIQLSIDRLVGKRLAFVAVLDSFLANPSIDQLPGNGVVLVVHTLADGAAAADLESRLRVLKERRFAIALEDCFDGPAFDRMALHAGYFLIQTTLHTPVLVAKDVESFDDFELCRKLGFALFHGPFVTSREDWSGNKVGPQALRVIDLLNRLRRDADTAELAGILRQDAVLSYRLLRYINSAASGLRQAITSIDNGLMLMGRQKMYRWLTLLLFGSAQASPRVEALLETALVRGRLMEGVDEHQPDSAREELFVTGLFSLLDRVLRVPMAEALKPLHLAQGVQAALLAGEGPYAPLLELALACESADQARLAAASEACGLSVADVNAGHFAALTWAQQVQG